VKTLFVFESPGLDLWAYASRRVAESTRLEKDGPVVEYVELTPRVRFGLWLAEDARRRWQSTYDDDEVRRCVLLIPEPGQRIAGIGPTLDAAIEDALAKLPAKGER
jgi:hypothetical protein